MSTLLSCEDILTCTISPKQNRTDNCHRCCYFPAQKSSRNLDINRTDLEVQHQLNPIPFSVRILSNGNDTVLGPVLRREYVGSPPSSCTLLLSTQMPSRGFLSEDPLLLCCSVGLLFCSLSIKSSGSLIAYIFCVPLEDRGDLPEPR